MQEAERGAAKRGVQIGGYIPPELRARTLEALRAWCPTYGEAACRHAEWGAVCVWLMKGPRDGRHPVNSASLATILLSEADQERLGFPILGAGTPTFHISALPDEVRAEVERVATETFEDWEREGRPFLAGSVERAQKLIQAYLAKEVKGEARDSANG